MISAKSLFVLSPTVLAATMAACTTAAAQSPQIARYRPLQAKLDVPMDTARTKPGAPVFASVTADWIGPDCALSVGATVTGHIVEIQTRPASREEARIVVAFDRADCNGERAAPIALTLYAVVDNVDAEESMKIKDPSGIFGAVTARPNEPTNQGGFKSSSPDGLSGAPGVPRSGAYSGFHAYGGGVRSSAPPPDVKAGEYQGDLAVKLGVGEGEGGSTILHSKQKNIRINKRATLILVPRGVVNGSRTESTLLAKSATPPEGGAASTGKSTVRAPQAAVQPALPPDPTEVCSANCSALGAGTDAPGSQTVAERSANLISLAEVGYRPKVPANMVRLNHEASANFLSATELLLTYDPPQLRRRVQDGWRPMTRRTVRAALVDTAAQRVERAVDWQVDGEGQYLWKAGPGRVLVHTGGMMVCYGAGLERIYSVPAAGQLQWLTAAPDGSRIAFGVLHERHTEEAHHAIFEATGLEPEEDVQVTVIDGRTGAVELSEQRSTLDVPPVLTDAGEVLVAGTGGSHWTIVEQSPEGIRKVIARISSVYPPAIFSVAGGLLLNGYDGTNEWFRLLAADGRTILKGGIPAQQIDRSIEGSAAGLFTLRTVEVTRPEQKDKTQDPLPEVRDEAIELRRIRDGRRIFNTHIRSFPPTADGYALSPDGRLLAVLTSSGLELFTVPVDRAGN